jgi:hypothetical protein
LFIGSFIGFLLPARLTRLSRLFLLIITLIKAVLIVFFSIPIRPDVFSDIAKHYQLLVEFVADFDAALHGDISVVQFVLLDI